MTSDDPVPSWAGDRCAECGFEYHLEQAESSGEAIVAATLDLAGRLVSGEVARRRSASVWSPLEYACHLRDVLLVQRERVLAARQMDRPSSNPMGRDERVEHEGYAEQDVGDVRRQLLDAAHLFANVLSRLDPAAWERTVMYNYPRALERSLRWVAVHTLHEVTHHSLDIRRQLD